MAGLTRPYCVGLTGGAGSGKSTVAEAFEKLGIEVVDTDVIAHRLTAAGGAAMSAIAQAFGADYVDAQGALVRARMRARVFADAQARRRLEAILHPLIRDDAIASLSRARSPYVLLVVPLLVEQWASYRDCVDRVLVVDCDAAQQIARISARPGLDPAQARAILASQAGREERLARADDVIDNRADLASLAPRVAELHGLYLRLARENMPCGGSQPLP